MEILHTSLSLHNLRKPFTAQQFPNPRLKRLRTPNNLLRPLCLGHTLVKRVRKRLELMKRYERHSIILVLTYLCFSGTIAQGASIAWLIGECLQVLFPIPCI